MTQNSTDDFAKLEQAGWSDPQTAHSYATDFAKAAIYSVPVMMEQVAARAGVALLDLCCGHGILAQEAQARGADVMGVDFSPAMLELARARVPGAEFVQGDAMAIPFDADSFDAVVIGFGIPHVPDPPQVFAEARRVLRPDGRLAYSVWQDREGGLKYVFDAIQAHGATGISLPPGPGAHDYADEARARAALSAAGFTDIVFTDVDSRWRVDDPSVPYDLFRDGTVRGGSLMRGQPEAQAQAIRAAVRAKVVAAHGNGPIWDIPIPSVVVSARVV